MYIRFFHGRKSTEEELHDWGFDGPIVGPINFQWTYGYPKLGNDSYLIHLKIEDNLVKIGENYYGDFELIEENNLWLNDQISKNGKKILSLAEFEKII